MFCISCGKELPPKAKFCPNCGTPVFAYDSANDSKDEDKRKNASTGLENGHEWVDLGLSVKWATCNIGAARSEDHGSPFAWGEVSPKDSGRWIGYRFLRNLPRDFIDPLTIDLFSARTKKQEYRMLDQIEEMESCISSHLTKYNELDGITQLDISDDAARVNWGGRWRMPSESDFGELRSRCLWTWTNLGGINGYSVSGPNGNSIFLPASAPNMRGGIVYWVSDRDDSNLRNAKGFIIPDSPEVEFRKFATCRCFPQPIRPVLVGF